MTTLFDTPTRNHHTGTHHGEHRSFVGTGELTPITKNSTFDSGLPRNMEIHQPTKGLALVEESTAKLYWRYFTVMKGITLFTAVGPIDDVNIWLGIGVAVVAVVFAMTWSTRHRKHSNCSMKRNKHSLLEMARNSSAASFAALKQVSSSTSFARLSEAVMNMKCFGDSHPGFTATVSAPELFVHVSVVQKMSLSEINNVIIYTAKRNRCSFNVKSFLAEMTPHVREVIAAIDTAVFKSRGINVLPSQVKDDRNDASANIDALYFIAALRLLVEWRSVKIVPNEYKTYATGMNTAKGDLIRNAAKVETAIHRWILAETAAGKDEIRTPTVRQLLEYELENNVHVRLPKLKDRTAAMGLVWMYRQLQFQTQIFANFLEVPDTYGSSVDAVRSAYKEVFSPYHSWAIQQVFNYSFNGSPPAALVFKMMNPEVGEKIQREVNTEPDLNFAPEVVSSSYANSFDEDYFQDEDSNVDALTLMSKEGEISCVNIGTEVKRGWTEFAANVEREWSAFVDDLVRGGNKPRSRLSCEATVVEPLETRSDPGVHISVGKRTPVPRVVLNEEALQLYVQQETARAARGEIECYLKTMKPLLGDVAAAIEGFGMNDPTKV